MAAVMPRDEVERRYANVRAAMERDGLEAVIVSGKEIIDCGTGVLVQSNGVAHSRPMSSPAAEPAAAFTLPKPGFLLTMNLNAVTRD